MLKITSDASVISAKAGEPLLFELVIKTSETVFDDLTGKVFYFSIFSDSDALQKQCPGEIVQSGDVAAIRWIISGEVTQSFESETYNFEIYEALDDFNRDSRMLGKLIIEQSADRRGPRTGMVAKFTLIRRITLTEDRKQRQSLPMIDVTTVDLTEKESGEIFDFLSTDYSSGSAGTFAM